MTNTVRSIHMERNEWLLVILFLVTLPFVSPYIRGDGNGYYAYVRSVVIDGDLHFENEYRRGDPAFHELAFASDGNLRPEAVSDTGRVRNQWSIGPSLLWSPFFLTAHALVGVLNRFGADVAPDGFSSPYRYFCAIGTAAYSFIGLMLSYRIARQLAGSNHALLATLGIWFASPLPVYMYFLPFHVHALAAFSVALFFWHWLRSRTDHSLRQSGWLGLAAGLMVQVYYLNATLLLIPLADWTWDAVTGAKQSRSRRADAIRFAAAILAGSISLIPHFLVKYVVHGSPWRTGYYDRFFWTAPRIWQVAFSPEHGMFLWTPVLLLAVIGLLLFARLERRLAVPLFLALAVFYYTVASYQNWHGQSSFGSRFFISWTPVFVLGLAALIRELSLVWVGGSVAAGSVVPGTGRVGVFGAAVVLLILSVWNAGFMFQWGTNLVPNRGAVDFAAVAGNQLTVVPTRAGGFLARYFSAREQVTREIEQGDLIERRSYELSR